MATTVSLICNVLLLAAVLILYYFACDQKKQITELKNVMSSFGITQEESDA